MKELAYIILTALTTSCWWAYLLFEVPKDFVWLLVISTAALSYVLLCIFIDNWE